MITPMKNIISTLIIFGTLSLILFDGCGKNKTTNEYDRLPDLPPDLAATLDPDTMATKITVSTPEPVQSPGVALAQCCGSSEGMTLKVKFPYTKCGPLRDFIVGPIGDVKSLAASGPGQSEAHPDFKVYKLTQFNAKTVLDQVVCVTSQGPWDATLTEDRHCNGYSPIRTLTISPYGDLISFVWNTSNGTHPESVTLVSCRQMNTSRFHCGGLSNCDCRSSTCPADQPCECNLPSNW